eukprot:755974-Hanusia_phi.AAC.5
MKTGFLGDILDDHEEEEDPGKGGGACRLIARRSPMLAGGLPQWSVSTPGPTTPVSISIRGGGGGHPGTYFAEESQALPTNGTMPF